MPADTVAAYIAAQPKASRPALRRLRRIIRKAVPKAEECMSYQMPTYKLGGRTVIHFAGWKEHVALYPGAGHVVAALKAELKPYAVSKGTIRFPLSEPLPERLIAKIAKARAQDVGAKLKKLRK
ncbi:MAG: DUF1801 domain-containing protein [Rhodospirillaceae bacterium]|nr:DUF1801 domain-containing protein [Rhodospirillaceae bacterium]